MPKQTTLEWLLNNVPKILLVYGIYAMFTIALFYMERRTYANLRAAGKLDHGYFRRVYSAVWVAIFVLMVGAVSYWVYVNIPRPGPAYISGKIQNLREQNVKPQTSGDPPFVVQKIGTGSPGTRFFLSRPNELPDSDGRYDLDWILEAEDKDAVVLLELQHRFQVMRAPDAGAAPSASLASPSLDSKVITKKFSLKLPDLLKYGDKIALEYVPDSADPVRNVGKLFAWDKDAGKHPIELQDLADSVLSQKAPGSARLWPALLPTLHAWGPLASQQRSMVKERSMFKEDGSYDERTGRLLVARLGSSDMEVQSNARRVLVDAGPRAWKFIRDTLDSPLPGAGDVQLVVANLARAVEDLEAARIPAPADVHFRLAMAFYRAQDYDAAARHFERAGEGPMTDDARFYRAYAYSKVKQIDRANRDYQQYVSAAKTNEGKSVALSNMAINYRSLQQDDLAASSYQAALKADPGNALANNNLACLYADRSMRLEEALVLANKALLANPDEALYKDTKGWVLFKLGRVKEALPLIEEAARVEPGNQEIQGHLSEVRRAMGLAAKK